MGNVFSASALGFADVDVLSRESISEEVTGEALLHSNSLLTLAPSLSKVNSHQLSVS